MDHIAKYHPVDVSDLPPSYLGFEDTDGSFSFDYRDPHILPNMFPASQFLFNTQSVDRNWGIWGHQLKAIFQGSIPNEALALVDGKRVNGQFCFSSPEVYENLVTYISEGFDVRSPKWFMVAPNDNDLVCTCHACLEKGNNLHSATGAVIDLLNRISQRFPEHMFFTIAYRTTATPPSVELRNNTGVFISTIDLPKKVRIVKEDRMLGSFVDQFEGWKKRSNEIYIWDYISNFDDYFTPYPVLNRMQEQLGFFHSLGAKGVLLNGGGYDPATFDEVKMYVLSALLTDTRQPLEPLIRNYFKKFYPVTGSVLAEYMIELENLFRRSNVDTGIYTGFRGANKLYFGKDHFLEMFEKVKDLEALTKGQERERVRQLISELSYTELQVTYLAGKKAEGFLVSNNEGFTVSPAIMEPLESLEEARVKGKLRVYREENGLLEEYGGQWKKLMNSYLKRNLVMGLQVQTMERKEALEDGFLLFDNVPGFSSDFNQGWLLSGDDLLIDKIRIAPQSGGKRRLCMRFLINERHKMKEPDRIEVIKGKRVVAKFGPKDFIRETDSSLLNTTLEINENDDLQIRIYRNGKFKNSVIACDEIQLF